MSEYTPSMDRIGDMYSWATGWRTEDRDEDTDLSENRRVMRAEFDRALAAHDADVRKAALAEAIALLEKDGYFCPALERRAAALGDAPTGGE